MGALTGEERSRGRLGAMVAVTAGVARAGAPGSRRARPGRKSLAPSRWSAWVVGSDALVVLPSAATPLWVAPSGEGAERATRPEPFGALGAAGPDEAASAATAATTVLASTAAAVARERLIRSDEGTVHCRGPPGRMRGGPGGGSSEVPDRPRDQAIRAPLFRGARHCSCERWPVVLDALAGAAVLVPAASSNGHSALAGEHGSP